MNVRIYEFIGQRIRPIELANWVKKIFLIKRKTFPINDNQFFLDPVSNFGIRLLRDGHYEQDLTESITRTLKQGDTFIDLGGNEGYFSILGSKLVGSQGEVICIEPQQRLWEVITKNLQLNGCFNVRLVPFVVSDKRDEVELILTPSINTGSSGMVGNKRNSLWKKQATSSIILDDLLNEKQIKLIKIDIEGFEFMALKGAVKMLDARKVDNIIVEFHPYQLSQLGQSEEEINKFLNDHGYFLLDGIYKPKK